MTPIAIEKFYIGPWPRVSLPKIIKARNSLDFGPLDKKRGLRGNHAGAGAGQ